ncbi:Nucleotide-binding universal stress protein, UspA family [Palleronia marisminoris]|uniref:Universal stress protein family protein n=1 Tax=Palleronia marisminoris TaxID=315423 RepID=A0A1Y5RJI2_9RHOB|nr:universal stress protein [Palleronia marisminoris]SFG24542.1 Nucleotide-binding universal stress protein, UspA family [Palleronia marisminoris]SLN19010.1 Universal stress protein family protein [Palleronia marisminoris]
MSYKTIATVVMPDADALESAIGCAARWNAHLDVTMVGRSQLDIPAMISPDLALSSAVFLEESRAELTAIEQRVRERLGREGIAWALDASSGRSAEFVGSLVNAIRLADLVILPHPSHAQGDTAKSVLEAVLYNSRVPILLVPGDETPTCERAVLAWDGNDVALAAIRAAMPLLKAAGKAEIVTVDPQNETAGRDLAVMLERHGVDASIASLPRSGRRVAEVLRDHVREQGADLLVMGAYGTRRLREVLLGGVTRDLLEAAPGPLLLAR